MDHAGAEGHTIDPLASVGKTVRFRVGPISLQPKRAVSRSGLKLRRDGVGGSDDLGGTAWLGGSQSVVVRVPLSLTARARIE